MCLDLKDQLGIYSMLGGFAGVALASGQPQRAVHLIAAAEIIRQAGGYASERIDKTQVDQFLDTTQAALDDAKFETAWKLGEEMSSEQAIVYALTGDMPLQPTD